MTSSSKTAGIVVALVVLAALVIGANRIGGPDPDTVPGRPPSVVTTTTPRATTPRVTTPRPQSSATPAPTAERDPETGLRWVALTSLPREAQQVAVLIERGGPFPYAKDGATFGNRERILPRQPSGYYHEYTVRTPGENDRGARRIVTGDQDRQLFYTGDHYASFVRVRR